VTRSTDIRIVDADCTFEEIRFRAPLKFGGRVVNHSYCMNVRVTAETTDGTRADGFGSMPVGNVWAWPTDDLSGDQTEVAMKMFAERVTEAVLASEPGHSIEIMHTMNSRYPGIAKSVETKLGHAIDMPKLAQLVAASPLDAAVSDAYGRVHSRNSYQTLGQDYLDRDIADFLGDETFRGDYLDKFVLAEPTAQLPLYHLVGALDPLTDADIGNRLDDGLPETLPEWINADGLTHLKIKLNGDDIDWDVQRVLNIDEIAIPTQAARGCDAWFYSCDFNEKCENVEYVLEFVNRVREQSPAAFDRIQYIEQPTSRDLKANPDNRMHAAAEIKPVVIDEALIDYESLLLSRELGYSGVALKACKGHSESLLLAAAAQKFGMFLCVQDLTCPGYSFLHSASLAARIPGIAAIEGNARQFCPGSNDRWEPQYPAMFDITTGSVGTGSLNGQGLGFDYIAS
jgi:L-alanine-DL-glutamate epimerase-like enolase superfamily enzyme